MPRKKWSNITNVDKKTIKDLKEKDVICLPSDKGTEFCIIQKDRYSQAALDHLNDSNTYQKVPRMTAKTVENKVNLVWKNICSRNKFPPFVVKSFVASNTELPKFYHLIKTHKTGPDIKIRPIVSNINGPTQWISWLLSKTLKPLLTSVPTHLENSYELIERIQDGDSNNNKTLPYPCSLDVVSLYTSIPIQEAIDNTVDRIEHGTFHLSRLDVAELLNATLNNMYFTFEDRIFRQTKGLPMGSSVSGILAILFMDKLEKIALSSYRLISPYKRYIDDIYLLPRHHEQSTPETKIWDRENHCITRRPISITTWLQSHYHDERRKLLWILQETCEKAAFRTPPVCPTKALKDQLHPQRTEAYTAEMFNPNNIQQTRPRLRQHSPPQRISRTHHTWNKTPAESPKRPPNTDKRVALSQNPVHLRPAKPKNHGNLQERKHPSANRPQVLHSETSPFTQHNRKEMQQTKLPHRRHQFMPTEKHRLSAHVQSLWRILHRKHDTIPTWSNKRTLDQRQLVGKKTSHNTPSQQQP